MITSDMFYIYVGVHYLFNMNEFCITQTFSGDHNYLMSVEFDLRVWSFFIVTFIQKGLLFFCFVLLESPQKVTFHFQTFSFFLVEYM